MSTDSEESLLLEEALQGDLPPPGTQARLQRRLLAAGVAVGNGMAVTTAAAAGGAPGAVSGFVGKALAMSWGIKLGALAVVAIPTVGLLVDSGPSAPRLSAPSPARKSVGNENPRAAQAQHDVTAPSNAEPSREPDAVLDEPAPPTLRSPARSPSVPQAGVVAAEGAARPEPSRDAFAEVDEATARTASTLAEETRILDGAFAELAAGNGARASELIAEHERRFPSGLLKQERQRAKQRLAEISRGE
jgi:hypothetical protein